MGSGERHNRNNGGASGQRSKSPDRPRPDTQIFDFDDLGDQPPIEGRGSAGISTSDAVCDKNTIDGAWQKPWVSTPGAPVDREAVMRLAEQGGDYLQLANRILQRYTLR